MSNQEYLSKYIDICNLNIRENKKIISILKNLGIYGNYIFDNLKIGYSNGNILEIIGDNLEIKNYFLSIGIIKNNREVYANYITIPVYDENKAILNIAFFNPYP